VQLFSKYSQIGSTYFKRKKNKWEATKNEAIEAHQNQDNVIKEKYPSNQMLDYVTMITIMKQLLIDGIVIGLE